MEATKVLGVVGVKPSRVWVRRCEVGPSSKVLVARKSLGDGKPKRLMVELGVDVEVGKRRPAMLQLERSIEVMCSDAAAVAWVREEFRRFGERLREYDGEGPRGKS